MEREVLKTEITSEMKKEIEKFSRLWVVLVPIIGVIFSIGVTYGILQYSQSRASQEIETLKRIKADKVEMDIRFQETEKCIEGIKNAIDALGKKIDDNGKATLDRLDVQTRMLFEHINKER